MLKQLQKSKNRLKDQKGFTIIEVLIVLAIAGLILLIVFLAVPALQRNSRNTTIKSSVQNVLGGVAEYEGANNGVPPTGIASAADGTVTYSPLNTTTIKVQAGTTVTSTVAAPAVTAVGPGAGKIVVSIGFKCDGTANGRAVAAIYSIETTSTTVYACADS